jgi:hypothetical protein
VMNCASACTATLPATPPSTYWNVAIQAAVGGSAVTISPNSLNLNGSASSLVIPVQGQAVFVTTDGTNYFSDYPLIPGTNVSMTPSAAGITVASTSSGSTAFNAITSGTNTMAAMRVGTGSSLDVSGSGTNNATSVNPTNSAVSGDCAGFSSTGSTDIPLKDVGLCGTSGAPIGVTPLPDANYTPQAGDYLHLLTMTPSAARTITLPQPGTLSTSVLVSSVNFSIATSPGTQSIATTSGNFIFVQTTAYNYEVSGVPTFSAPTDTNGDAFTLVNVQTIQSGTTPYVVLGSWYAATTYTGSQTVTVAFSAAGAHGVSRIVVLQNITGPGGAAQYLAATGIPTNPTVQTYQENDLVINMMQPVGSCSAQPASPSGFTTLFSNDYIGSQMSYAVLPIATTYTLTPASSPGCAGPTGQQIASFLTTTITAFTNGYNFLFRNNGTAPVVFSPTSSYINSNYYTATTSGAGVSVYPGQTAAVWSDGTNWQMLIQNGSINADVTTVTVDGNVNTAQDLMAATVKANTTNHTLNSFHVFGGGTYSTEASNTSTITIAVTLGTATLASWTTGANPGGISADTWNVDLWFTSAGINTAGFKAHGNLVIKGIGSTPLTYNDSNTGTTSTIDQTMDQTLQVAITFSVAGSAAGNIGTEDQLVVSQVN